MAFLESSGIYHPLSSYTTLYIVYSQYIIRLKKFQGVSRIAYRLSALPLISSIGHFPALARGIVSDPTRQGKSSPGRFVQDAY